MDFELDKEQTMIKQAAREVMEKEIIPIASEYDQKNLLHDRKILKELLDLLIPLGYLGGLVPEEDGGYGLDLVSWGILVEELFRAYGSLAAVVALQSTCGGIHYSGSPEQKARFLPSLLTGEKIICNAVTEPNAGSNPAEIETFATLDGDHYIINGTKTWITNGTISDVALVVAQTKEGSGVSGICHLIVEKDVSPYEVKEIPKMGMRSSPTAEIVFRDCRVPKENLLVAPGQGLKKILQLIQLGRASTAIGAVGMSQAAIDASVRYAKIRHQFGKPIGGFQLIQEMIADMIAETEASRLLAFRALSMLDKGLRCDKETSVAKFYANEAAVRVTSSAIQIHGAMGLSEELSLERYFRDARSWTIPDGSTQIQKLIVGRNVLGLDAIR
ncbi:acyl-CoA dehydrogenase family protein [Thermodesulfobacteriota bacterium]